MSLRPQVAQWFEVVVPRNDLETTLEALSRHGTVQFEARAAELAPAEHAELSTVLDRFHAIHNAYASLLPEPIYTHHCCTTTSLQTAAASSVERLEHWQRVYRTELEQWRQLGAWRASLATWRTRLDRLGPVDVDLGRLGASDTFRGVLVEPAAVKQDATRDWDAEGLWIPGRDPSEPLWLGLLPQEQFTATCAAVARAGGRCHPLPQTLHGTPEGMATELARQEESAQRQLNRQAAALRDGARQLGLDQAIGVLRRIEWLLPQARVIDCDDSVCWITGWSRDGDPEVMRQRVAAEGVQAEIHYPEAPSDRIPPTRLDNPGWAKAFEPIVAAFGYPGRDETDPSRFVAVLGPLMFGYMFGDVGHGLILALVGWWLRRRHRAGNLILAGGVGSVGFGFLYGEVFGVEGMIPALWVHPLDAPLLVLLTPLAFGVAVIHLGLALGLVESCWRAREEPKRWVGDLAQLVVYWSVLLAFVDWRFLALAPLGASLCIVRQWLNHRRIGVVLGSLGALVEGTYQLAINTLSFIRVGAFALAHAGLSVAVLWLADDAPGTMGHIVVFVLGNVLILTLEVLVVTVQTTRLLLFEFFTRFFTGSGRRFQPAPLPPTVR